MTAFPSLRWKHTSPDSEAELLPLWFTHSSQKRGLDRPDAKLGSSCLDHGQFLRVPLQTVVAAISLGTSPLFKQPQGKLLWVQTWDAPRRYPLGAECVGLWHHKQSPYSVPSSYGHVAASWWKPGKRGKPWLKKSGQKNTGHVHTEKALASGKRWIPGVLCTVLGALGPRYSEVSGRSPGLWARRSGWVLAPRLTEWPWTSCITTLACNFLNHKTGLVRPDPSISWDYCEDWVS